MLTSMCILEEERPNWNCSPQDQRKRSNRCHSSIPHCNTKGGLGQRRVLLSFLFLSGISCLHPKAIRRKQGRDDMHEIDVCLSARSSLFGQSRSTRHPTESSKSTPKSAALLRDCPIIGRTNGNNANNKLESG